VSVIGAVLVASIIGLVAVNRDVSVHAAIIQQHEKRIEKSESDTKQLTQCLNDIKADNREMKALLTQLIEQHKKGN